VIRIPFEGSQQITFVPVPSAVHMGGGVPAKGPPYLNRFFARGGHGPGYSGGERIRQASGFAVSAKTQFAPPSTFWVPPIIVVVVPTFLKEWGELEPTYTVAIKARPSC
jgi:hypothetical protein